MTRPSSADVVEFIVSRLKTSAGSSVAADHVTGDVHLLNAGVIDSLGFVTLVAAIEERFNVEIDFGDADPDEFLTVRGLARCVASSPVGDHRSPDG